MKVLYLTYDGLSDPLGQSQILPYLIGLSRKGHFITVISSEKKAYSSNLPWIKSQLEENGIMWHSISYTKSPLIISTIYDVLKIWKICIGLVKKEKFDIVHCRSYITSLIGTRLKKKHRLKFIFDPRGFYADERIDGGMWNQNSFIYRFIYRYFKNREADFLSLADHTITLTESARKEIHTWKSIDGKSLPIKVIPCCVDTELFSRKNLNKEAVDQWKEKLGIRKNDLILSYVGAVGTWYLLDEMLDFFSRMKLKLPESKFLVISHEDPEMIQEKSAQKKISEDSIIIIKLPHREIPHVLALSSLSIFFIKPVYSKKASSPTKQAEILSMGIPIICNTNIGDTDMFIRKTESGSIIRTFTNEDYDFVIDDIQNLLNKDSEKIRKVALDNFSLESGVNKYDEVYQSVMKTTSCDDKIHS
ncbi:MAG: glycosyltransferase [Bacteroidetes bacterium]|nr:MAG: glycosyltransferase [Bacteroidota bacterium]REJ99700.1 MAG: glycosyltransferase [Bacteroidota bacterium]REK33933.1 MAG: glycosyltransferase [Bacteroidota bacterium]REK47699.1 MAG: glycosyltransferase [Bacteroidota bacterium]